MFAPPSDLSLPDNPVAPANDAFSRDSRLEANALHIRPRMGAQDFTAILVACRAKVTLVEDNAVNAWAHGTGIVLTTGLLTRCKSENDLALVLGHEMAHNLLQHQQQVERDGGSTHGLLPSPGGTVQSLHDTEEAADRFAVQLAMTAGYDLMGMAAFMEGLLDQSVTVSTTHPGTDRRLALLRNAIAEAQGSDHHQPHPPVS